LVLFSGVGCLIVGCILALQARGIHSFIACSGINHMGFILCGISCNTSFGFNSAVFYLIIYVLTLISFFSLLSTLKTLHGKFIVTLTQLESVQDNPFIRIILFILMFSFAGIPPLAGFFGKSSILLCLLNNGQVFVCCVILVTAVVSGYYYLRILSIASFKIGRVMSTRFLFYNYDTEGGFKYSSLSFTLLELSIFLVFFALA
jgi:NADH-quinone oxidoreductase subunit N